MNTESFHKSQRGYFAGALLEEMKKDPDIFLVTGDLGYGMLDKIKSEFPDRFINVGAAEQTLIGVAIGLAQEGKKPFAYTITSFFLRAAESLSLYVGHERANVKLVGGGRDDDYKHDGFSHDATKAQEFIDTIPGVMKLYPQVKEDVPAMVKTMVNSNYPSFISLRR